MEPEDIVTDVANVFKEEGNIEWISVSVKKDENKFETKIASSKHSPNTTYSIGLGLGIFVGIWLGISIGMIL